MCPIHPLNPRFSLTIHLEVFLLSPFEYVTDVMYILFLCSLTSYGTQTTISLANRPLRLLDSSVYFMWNIVRAF